MSALRAIKQEPIRRAIMPNEADRAITCPECGAPMIVELARYRKTGKRGDMVEARLDLFCICEAR